MIGKHSFEIGPADFVRGMSTSADLSDGGFSPETPQINLTYSPGVAYQPAAAVDKSTNLTGEAIAYTPTNVLAQNGFILATDGKILSIDGSQALTASSALSGTYTTGTSDIAQFIDKIYATSSTDVARMNTDLSSGNATWWSATLGKGVLTSGVRHPLCIFQDRLWIGDANSLHNIVDSSNGNKAVLLLTAEKEITALGVDQASGQMLIATTQGPNYSNTTASGNSIFTYNGTSATYTREYAVDGMVTGFRSVGGVTYVFYGAGKIGYWNGSGITFLRKLRNVTLAGADLTYKHHTANIENTLYVVDGKQVLAYGEVLPGRKVWYYAHYNQQNLNKYSLICPVGSGNLGLGFATAKFYIFDTTSVSTTNTFSFYSNKYRFPRPVEIRGFYVEYSDAVADNDNNRTLYYNTEVQIGGFISILDPTGSFSALKNNSGGPVCFTEVPTAGMAISKLRTLQLRYNADTTITGLRRIVVYYDVAE